MRILLALLVALPAVAKEREGVVAPPVPLSGPGRASLRYSHDSVSFSLVSDRTPRRRSATS